ncbi:MAG: pyridoxal-5'-phosphate-dependent protein subunit beta, partial [Acidobacteriota bacterium]
MNWTELSTEIVDPQVRDRAVRRLSEARVVLPTFRELAEPSCIAPSVTEHLAQVDADAPEASNLFRVHWYNDRTRRGQRRVPCYLDLPEALTGTKARILVALGRYFPMIGAHKVLAAYGCLVPRIVTGQFDPERHKA